MFFLRFFGNHVSETAHGLIDFAKNACRKTATKTLPFFGKAGAGLAPIAFLITPPTVALGTSVRPYTFDRPSPRKLPTQHR